MPADIVVDIVTQKQQTALFNLPVDMINDHASHLSDRKICKLQVHVDDSSHFLKTYLSYQKEVRAKEVIFQSWRILLRLDLLIS